MRDCVDSSQTIPGVNPFRKEAGTAEKKATKTNVKYQHDYCLAFFFPNDASNSIILCRMLLSQPSLCITGKIPGVPTADVESAAKKSSPRMPWCTDSARPKVQDGFVWQSSLRSSGFPNILQVHHTNTLATVARLGPATKGIWTCVFFATFYDSLRHLLRYHQSTFNMAKHLDKIPVNLEVKRICFFQSASYLRRLSLSPRGKSPSLRVSGLWRLSMSRNLQWCDVVDHLA